MKYLKKKGYKKKISYYGTSIGGAIGILLTKEFPDLVCLAVDSPYLSFKEMIRYKANSLHISNKTFELTFSRVCKKINDDFGVDYNSFQDPIDVMSQITQPIIMAQLVNDQYDMNTYIDLFNSMQTKDKYFYTYIEQLRTTRVYENLFKFIVDHNKIDL